ncbi:hypothetical protein SLS64_003515 [Diaporthe eres]
MASTTAVSPTTLWAGPRRGPVFELRDFFGGARERCDFHVEHYAHQHVTKNRFILVDAPLHYDQSVIEVALGNGFTAFQLLFHMGVTPMAHVWEDLYNKLSNPPTAIEDMDPDSLAQFLGVVLTQGQDKDEILTQFVRPTPPPTPGADLKSIDTEDEYLEFMKDREREFWEPRRAEHQP